MARALGFATEDVLADWEQGPGLLVEQLTGQCERAETRSVVPQRRSSEVEHLLVGEGLAARA